MRLFRLLLCCLAATAFNGCAGYRLGPTNGLAPGEKSIRVQPFANETMQPRLGDAATSALRKSLQRDGTYRLATGDRADIVVSGTLKRYDRHEISFLSRDVITARDYRVTLAAHIVARDTATGKKVLDDDVVGYTLIRIGSDLASAERQALPLLADDLAKRTTALLADGSW